MKDKNYYDHTGLLERIEAYFDCRLTDEEERQLRRDVATTHLVHPSVEEARALMGFACPPYGISPHRKSSRFRLMVAAAAAVVIAAGFAFPFLRDYHRQSEDSTVCFAYINGCKVTDEEAVMAFVEGNMREAGKSEAFSETELEAELAEVAPLVEIYESDNNLYL